jgi:putative glutamine amidotransferase
VADRLADRPRIGITTSRGRGRLLWWFLRLAVARAGGRAVRLVVGREPDLDRLDGVIVGGGDDISATIYGGELDPAVRVDPERDALEHQVLRHAFAQALPVLGICRGAQMINVFLGGSLHTDIHAVYEQAPRQRTVLPRKTVHVTPDSRLGSILECLHCRVNALHHQSVDVVGRELRVVARDEHDMIQAIEDPAQRFVIGVQWHPEFLIFDRGQQRLFRRLVQTARRA